ncbi:MAG: histidine phosphatase family protein [Acidobacteriia bacterium]|nr:histidine phosphatase family protein [Terriglobia bacterium]
MAIYLVQHGAARAEAEDPQRSLTGEGRRTVERIGEHLAKCGVALDRIEHSDKLRARQTAEILAVKLHPAHGTVQGLLGTAAWTSRNALVSHDNVADTDQWHQYCS